MHHHKYIKGLNYSEMIKKLKSQRNKEDNLAHSIQFHSPSSHTYHLKQNYLWKYKSFPCQLRYICGLSFGNSATHFPKMKNKIMFCMNHPCYGLHKSTSLQKYIPNCCVNKKGLKTLAQRNGVLCYVRARLVLMWWHSTITLSADEISVVLYQFKDIWLWCRNRCGNIEFCIQYNACINLWYSNLKP